MNSNRKSRSKLGTPATQLAFIAVILVFWEAAARSNPQPYLPQLSSVASSYVELYSPEALREIVLPSVFRVVVGFTLGVAGGAVLGLAMGFIRGLEPWVRPVLEFFRAIPAAAILPGALLLLGSTDTMRVSIIALGCTFPVLLAALDGARGVDALMIDTARISGLSRMQILRRVIAPAALPKIFAGTRTALGLALIMMVISELMASDNGLGHFILQAQRLFQAADVYAGVLLIGTIGFLFTALTLRLESRLLRWHSGWRQLPA